MARISPEDLIQLIYDEVNKAIRTTAAVVFQGEINLGAVQIKDPDSERRVRVKHDGTDNAAVVTANVLPLPAGAASEAKQDALLAKDFATNAALLQVLAKLASVGLDAPTLAALEEVAVKNFPGDYPDATTAARLQQLLNLGPGKDATLLSILAKLADVELDADVVANLKQVAVTNLPPDYPDAGAHARLDALSGKDFATQATLTAVLAKLASVGLDAPTLAALESVSVQNFPADFPDAGTHARLDALNGKDFAKEATLLAVLAKLIPDPATAPRQDTMIGLLGGGAREHRELTVSTTYDAAANKAAFTTGKKHFRVFSLEDVYWVDSAASDADAAAKLAAANQRGFIRSGDRLELSLRSPVTRLDFLARRVSGLVYITALE
jgi:hypothetical protein